MKLQKQEKKSIQDGDNDKGGISKGVLTKHQSGKQKFTFGLCIKRTGHGWLPSANKQFDRSSHNLTNSECISSECIAGCLEMALLHVGMKIPYITLSKTVDQLMLSINLLLPFICYYYYTEKKGKAI